MNNTIDQYMERVRDLLDKTRDPFASHRKNEILTEIREIATKNWLESGEPILNTEQLVIAYDVVRKKTPDKTFEYICGFNVCLN